jgi:hypothetical protein
MHKRPLLTWDGDGLRGLLLLLLPGRPRCSGGQVLPAAAHPAQALAPGALARHRWQRLRARQR